MKPDDHICYCYHVTLRKLENYARRERPQCASQMTQCLGAGTGCGWCIPFLEKIQRRAVEQADAPQDELSITPEEYAAARATYRQSGDKNTF